MSSNVPQLSSDEWYVYLCVNRPVGVAELSAMTGFSEAEVTQHLATLRQQGLISREGGQGAAVYKRTSGSSSEDAAGSAVAVGPEPPGGNAVAGGSDLSDGNAVANSNQAAKRAPAAKDSEAARPAAKNGAAAKRNRATKSAEGAQNAKTRKSTRGPQNSGAVGNRGTARNTGAPRSSAAPASAAAKSSSAPRAGAKDTKVANSAGPSSQPRATGQRPGSSVAKSAAGAEKDRPRQVPAAASVTAPPAKDADPAPPGDKRRVSRMALLAAAVAAVLTVVTVLLLASSRDPDVDSGPRAGSGTDVENTDPAPQTPSPEDPTSTPSAGESTSTPAPSDPATPAPTAGELQLQFSSYSGAPFESVPIQGTYAGAEPGTALSVQRRQDGEWVSFPLPAVTGDDGTFSTFVQLGAGRYQLRVVDLESDVVSDQIVLRIG